MKRTLFLVVLLMLCVNSFAQHISGAWSGTLDISVTQLHLTFHFNQDQNGKDIVTMDCPDQNIRGIGVQIRHLSADSVNLEVPNIGLQYSAKLKDLTLVGQFKQMGMTLPLILEPENKQTALSGGNAAGEEPISGSWLGLLDAGVMKLHVVIRLEKNEMGQDVCFMDSPDQSIKGIAGVILHCSADSLSIRIPRVGITYSARLEEGRLKGFFSQSGQTLPLEMSRGSMNYKRPQHPLPPYPYRTEEVKFRNEAAKATLAGTLTYPTDYQEGQQVPVVLMVTGSGPENRDEEIFEHKPFLVIADYLARHGIATLRYDDRRVGESTGDMPATTTRETADDAKQGIVYLRNLKKFSKVGLLGHSEGANVMFILGAKDLIDFGVSMAGVGVLGRDALYAQAKKIVESSGQEFPYDLMSYMSLIGKQENPWLDYFINYDPTRDIQKTTCPVFALNGNNDLQVIATQNLLSIKNSLPKHPKNKVKLYPGLNHLFQHCQTGNPNEYTSIEETISPEVLNDITNWIKSL